jgi:hypothetical protein
MSYQLLEEDEAWEDNMDRVLITQPIIGCAFKKSYYDPVQGHNVSKNILAKDLYIPYYAESLETSPRITEIIYLTHNDVYERVARGLYVDYEEAPPPAQEGADVLEAARAEAQGIVRPGSDPIQPLEFWIWMAMATKSLMWLPFGKIRNKFTELLLDTLTIPSRMAPMERQLSAFVLNSIILSSPLSQAQTEVFMIWVLAYYWAL